MQQLFFIVVSFLYGFIIALLHSLFFHKVSFWEILYFLAVTLGYVYIFYLINSGEIHIYNKVVLVLGYILFYYLKKCKIKRKLK